MSIFIAILVFSVIIVVHELGHYWAAKACGIMVEEFAVGMGPKLVGIRRGETLFSLRLVPLGGFCKMLGDEPEKPGKTVAVDNGKKLEIEPPWFLAKKSEPPAESAETAEQDDGASAPRTLNPRSLPAKPIWQRIIVMSSGVVMNIVLAFVALFVIFGANGFNTVDTTVGTLLDGTPAHLGGLLPGDRIESLNGRQTRDPADVRLALDRALAEAPGSPVAIEILRDGQRLVYNIIPDMETGRLGFYYAVTAREGLFTGGAGRVTFGETVGMAVDTSILYVRLIFDGLAMLITRQASMDDFMGPIGIVTVIGDAYTAGLYVSPVAALWNLLSLAALLSVNLAVFNLLPIPALDGGRIIFLLIEGIRRKPLNPEKEGLIHFAGFVLLLILVVFVAFNDVQRLI